MHKPKHRGSANDLQIRWRSPGVLFQVVYIAPLKALVRERIDDWGTGLCRVLRKRMVELTGEYTPDMRALLAADIIICTPEKWDGISRSWKTRGYVKQVIRLSPFTWNCASLAPSQSARPPISAFDLGGVTSFLCFLKLYLQGAVPAQAPQP